MKQVADPGALDHARVDHVVLVQLLGQIGFDPRGNEFLQPVGLRLPQRAADAILGDGDLGDLALIEQDLEPAVGDRWNFSTLNVQVLHEQNPYHRGDDVPEVDQDFLVHRGLLIAPTCLGARSWCKVDAETDYLRDDDGRARPEGI